MATGIPNLEQMIRDAETSALGSSRGLLPDEVGYWRFMYKASRYPDKQISEIVQEEDLTEFDDRSSTSSSARSSSSRTLQLLFKESSFPKESTVREIKREGASDNIESNSLTSELVAKKILALWSEKKSKSLSTNIVKEFGAGQSYYNFRHKSFIHALSGRAKEI